MTDEANPDQREHGGWPVTIRSPARRASWWGRGRRADYHLHVRGFKERVTTTTPFDRRRNLQLQINQKMYRHCPTFEMVVECV
jgi:hypothetical protein